MPVVASDPSRLVPSITIPTGESLSVLSRTLLVIFQELPPATQRKAIRLLENYRQEAYTLPKGHTQEQRKNDHAHIDRISWQLAQCLRYSTSTRIIEALGPLTFLADSYSRINGPDRVDVVPTLYIGVALSRIDGEEERAIRAFNEAFNSIGSDHDGRPALNLIWARANLARLLRRMNRVSAAKEQEFLARQWIILNPHAFTPAKINSTLADDVGTGTYILDHPDVLRVFNSWVMLTPTTALVGGIHVTLRNP